MRDVIELEGTTGFEAETATDEDKWDVIESVAVAFSELVGPDDGRVVEHAAGAAWLRNGIEFFR